jgi:hypothetical protein
VETILPWNELPASVAKTEKLAQPGEFDALAFITNSYSVLRRYAPQFMEAFEFRSSPATEEGGGIASRVEQNGCSRVAGRRPA